MAEQMVEVSATLAADAVVDAAGCPVILTDEQRRVVSTNPRGQRALDAGAAFVVRKQQLVPAVADDQQPFSAAHQAVAGGSVRTRQLVVGDATTRHGTLVTLVRLSAAGSAAPCIGVLLAGPGYARTPDPELLRSLLGVTSAEVQLIVALCQGETLRSYADARGLSLHTVRTQLRDVYRKSGLRSQLELVRLALSYVP